MADLLSLERIRTEGTQVRVALSETVIREYAEAFAQGDEFPPIEVYYDETATGARTLIDGMLLS